MSRRNPLPHAGQVRLTCTSHGPDPIDADLERRIDELLTEPSGWLIYNTHGLDDEGWGPLSSVALERLLGRLVEIPTVRVVPVGRALVEAAEVGSGLVSCVRPRGEPDARCKT